MSYANALLRFLMWCRVVDSHDGNVSLTDVGTIVVLAKIATNHTASIPDLAALLAMLLARAHKKHMGKDARNTGAVVATAAEKAGQSLEMVGRLLTKVNEVEERLKVVDNRTRPTHQARG